MSATRKRRAQNKDRNHSSIDEDQIPLIQHQSTQHTSQDEFQYKWDKTKQTPWKAIWLAIFLFFVGTILIVIGTLIVADIVVLDNKDRGIAFLILGLICFIPGSYYVFLTIEIVRKNPKYSYMDFPEM